MALKAGTSADFENSMAAAIQGAFKTSWKDVMKTDAPPDSNEMKVLFLAIAKGVIQHLVANKDAFVIKAESSVGGDINFTIKIDSISANG